MRRSGQHVKIERGGEDRIVMQDGWTPGESWRDYSRPSLPPLLESAVECFVESGYHGTTIRTLSRRAGLSVPGYYHHHASKQSVLVQIVDGAMKELLARTVAAVDDAGPDVISRLDAYVECLVLFHAHRGRFAFIASSEIRALEPEARAAHITARDRQQALLDDLVDEGIRAGRVTVSAPREAVRALITMCVGVSQWYRAGGALTPEQLAAEYVGFGHSLLGVI